MLQPILSFWKNEQGVYMMRLWDDLPKWQAAIEKNFRNEISVSFEISRDDYAKLVGLFPNNSIVKLTDPLEKELK